MDSGGWTDYVETKREQVRAELRHELRALALPALVVPALADAGQVNRGVLTVLVAEALGASGAAVATGFGVVAELIHRASVIHDDIQDHDHVRRGVPTFHVAFGLPPAIAVADVLLAGAFAKMLEHGDAGATAAVVRTYHAMAHGQLMDISGPLDGAAPDWARPAELKTGALVELAFDLGARASQAPPHVVRDWAGVGRLCGSAFQLINDVRNARDEEDRATIAASDLAHGRFSSVRLYAEYVLGARSPWPADVIEAACQAVEQEARRRMEAAHGEILRIGPTGFASGILSVLTAPKPSAAFTLQDPAR